ncbi:hypothetical protein B0H65DRAFT_414979 [Neurospora tetraspora]|uniref:Uncharacterized protein n=1 Tax=Neurospora tetraspora TaxID=94610 RepID=A0AAE0JPY4_9PEZI|nr:hypothetical protein B0H65DRAFT_414979 [Neurospora tetraspora]
MTIEEYDQYEQAYRDESDHEEYIRGNDINKENKAPSHSHSVPPTLRAPLANTFEEREERPLATVEREEPTVHTDLPDAIRSGSDTDTTDQMDRNEELQAQLAYLNRLADVNQTRIKELEIQQLAYNRQRRHIHRQDRWDYEDTFKDSQKKPEELIALIQASLQGLKKKITRDSKWTHKFNLDEKYNRQIQTEFYAGPIDDDSFIEPYPPRQSFQSIGVTAFEANVYTVCDRPWSPQAGDHPQVHPGHPSHGKIAWIQCLYDACPWHLSYKMEHDHFPQRVWENDVPIPVRTAHHKDSISMWDTCTPRKRDGGGRLMRLVLKDGYTRECMESPHTRYQDCCKINCAVHMADKARQWHSRQAMREERAFQRTQRKEETAVAASSSTSETASGSSSKSKSQRKRRARGGRRRQGNGASSSREDHE